MSSCRRPWAAAGRATVTSSPSTSFTHWPGGWQLLDGTVVATSWTQLTSGDLADSIYKDENDAEIDTRVWTGTNTDRTDAADDCNDWTGNPPRPFGLIGPSYGGTGATFEWTAQEQAQCSLAFSIYCFQQ